MSTSLRVILIICSVITLFYVARKIRKASLRIGDGLIWLAVSVFFILISCFPGIIYWFCGLLHIMSPSNFVFLLVIAFLLLQLFYMALRQSRLESRLDHLAQEVALRDEKYIHLSSKERYSKAEAAQTEPLKAESLNAESLEADPLQADAPVAAVEKTTAPTQKSEAKNEKP